MAKAHPPEKLAMNTFLLSVAGIAAWIIAAFLIMADKF